MNNAEDTRVALHQQLTSDLRLGITSVPLPRELLDRLTPPQTGSAAQTNVGPAKPTAAPSRAEVPRPASTVRTALAPATAPGPRAIPGITIIGEGAAADGLKLLYDTQVRECRKCPLCETRTQTVFGQGLATPRLVFVGEAPGYDEDKQGLAFVGAAGQLLTKMIAAMGLSREEVFICNVLKCRPPGNRTPTADEILACSPYLHEQLRFLTPDVIVALGAPATKTLLNTAESIGKLRGRWHQYNPAGAGAPIALMPTYHPAYLLRTPGDKKLAWDDLQMVMERLGLPKK